jgi:hypothetical protein
VANLDHRLATSVKNYLKINVIFLGCENSGLSNGTLVCTAIAARARSRIKLGNRGHVIVDAMIGDGLDPV